MPIRCKVDVEKLRRYFAEGLTARQAAERTGYSQSTVSKWKKEFEREQGNARRVLPT
jgi:transposase